MSVKTEVLELFENNRGIHLSGVEIAGKLNVSRNAVWKAVKSLQAEGYDIEGVNNKGYCMKSSNDVLSAQGIEKYLDEVMAVQTDIEVYKTVDSTNTRLKELAVQGEPEWKIILAEQQTEGKGRMNRAFYSPAGAGIYMSILFRPKFSASESLFITTMAAVAVAKAIESVLHIRPAIKWVNDIFCEGKKVCGILTEAAVNVESGYLDYAVLGIGVNVKKPEGNFPKSLKNIAISLADTKQENEEWPAQDDIRCRLAAEIINNIGMYYSDMGNHSFMKEYVEYFFLIGKSVVIVGKESEELLVKGIDEHAGLIVQHKDGSIETLSSGEVSVKPLQQEAEKR